MEATLTFDDMSTLDRLSVSHQKYFVTPLNMVLNTEIPAIKDEETGIIASSAPIEGEISAQFWGLKQLMVCVHSLAPITPKNAEGIIFGKFDALRQKRTGRG